MESQREAEGRKNRWLNLAETMEALGGRSAKTVYARGKSLGARKIGHFVFFDRGKVEALKRRKNEADEKIAELGKTHLTTEEAARMLGMRADKIGVYAEASGIPVARVKHPFVKGKPTVFVDRAAILRHLGRSASTPVTPEERDGAIDAALSAYADNRDIAGLHNALGGFARGELEQAAIRYRRLLNEARERASEETAGQAFKIGGTLDQRLRENRKREGARVSAREEHNRVLAMESALREVIDKRGTQLKQNGKGLRPPGPSAEQRKIQDRIFAEKPRKK